MRVDDVRGNNNTPLAQPPSVVGRSKFKSKTKPQSSRLVSKFEGLKPSGSNTGVKSHQLAPPHRVCGLVTPSSPATNPMGHPVPPLRIRLSPSVAASL